jgi:GT2 family glycosyltransferase
MNNAPLFSAVILSFNSARYIEKCVASLLAAFATFEQPCEILIFDNGSSDNSTALVAALVERHPAHVKALYSDVNLGTTVSRNRALAVARGAFILILDSDATIDGMALGILQAALQADASIGIAVPQLRYPDGRFQLSTDQFPTIARKIQRFFTLRAMEGSAQPRHGAGDVDYAISACWLLPRAVVERVGPLDEKIFYSPEDVDYCVRVWLAGYRIVYLPTAVAIHDAQELSRRAKFFRFTLSHAGGLLYLFRKHRYAFSRRGLVRRFPRPPAHHD